MAGGPPATRHMQPAVSGLILAGGRSRRFGSDKAAHEIDGQAMISVAYQALRTVTDDIIVSVRQEEQEYDVDARYVVDRYRGMGPLAGLDAAFRVARNDWLVVLACDMPNVGQLEVNTIVAECRHGGEAVVATDEDGLVQPLCAAYYRPAALPPTKLLLQRRHLSMMGLLDQLAVRTVRLSENSLFNVNRPVDLYLLSLL